MLQTSMEQPEYGATGRSPGRRATDLVMEVDRLIDWVPVPSDISFSDVPYQVIRFYFNYG